MAVGNIIKSIQDIMRQDTGVDGDAQRISQLVWMIFLKIFDDKEQEYKLLDDKYVSPIPERLRWRAWAANPEGITGEELLDFINNDLFKTLKGLSFGPDDDPRGFIVKEVFEDAYNYMKSGTLIRQVANKISEIDFNIASEKHLFGDIYEQILKDLQSAGNAGEYYTPRAVTQFMTDMVNPRLGEKILDPACGTGGFLVCALENIRRNEVKNVEDNAILQTSIFGVDKKPLPHLLCVTNMLLHGIEVPSTIRRDNTLSRPLRDYAAKDRVDVILTNPPFGGIEEDGIQANFPAAFRTKETADLFLILIMTLLRDGGRGAIVLPDGTLFGEGVKTRIKERLLEGCNLHTIVRLPNGVFNPYTGIKTNLLFFTKGEPTKEIWYYEHPYPPGYKSYSKTKPIRIEEFEPEKAWWDNRQENEFAWLVSVEAIKAANYNLDTKNPNKNDEDLGDPEVLLAKYKKLLAEAAETRETLKQELMSALDRFLTAREPDDFTNAWRLLRDNFDFLYTAPETIIKLRQAILQLAVQGKLVPQNPNDEPASVLLTKIKAEKERLSREKKIKKTPPLPPVSLDETPFVLPNGWEWVRLPDITHDCGQKIPDVEFTYIDVSAIDNRIGAVTNEVTVIQPDDAPSRARKLVRLGSVIYSTVRPYLLNIAVIDKEFQPAPIVSTAFAVLHPYEGLVGKFLFYYLRSRPFIDYVEVAMTGMAYPAINDTKLQMGIVPLPPHPEQHRIVAKADQLMTLCDELESKLIMSQTKSEKLVEAAVKAIAAG